MLCSTCGTYVYTTDITGRAICTRCAIVETRQSGSRLTTGQLLLEAIFGTADFLRANPPDETLVPDLR